MTQGMDTLKSPPGPGIQGLRDQASADHSSHTSSRCLWAQRKGGTPSLSICLSVSVEVSANLGKPPGQTLGAPCMGTFSLSLRWGAPSPPPRQSSKEEPSLSTIVSGAFTALLLHCSAFPTWRKHEPQNPTGLTLDPSSPPSPSPSLLKTLSLRAFCFLPALT